MTWLIYMMNSELLSRLRISDSPSVGCLMACAENVDKYDRHSGPSLWANGIFIFSIEFSRPGKFGLCFQNNRITGRGDSIFLRFPLPQPKFFHPLSRWIQGPRMVPVSRRPVNWQLYQAGHSDTAVKTFDTSL